MKKRIVSMGLLVLFAAGGIQAGVVRFSAKVVKGTAKVASHPVRHPVKDAKHVGHAVRSIVW